MHLPTVGFAERWDTAGRDTVLTTKPAFTSADLLPDPSWSGGIYRGASA
jgi:hypothetical protein